MLFTFPARIASAALTLAGLAALASPASAAVVDITVTIENLAAENGVSFAPLRVGFHNGTYDAFNNGEAAGAAIVSVAEGGSGSDWFPAFQAADPTAVLGTVANGGPAVPSANAGVGNSFSSSASTTFFSIDTSVNPFFTFANMVIPSNDLFLGNDNPQAFQFDANGNLADILLTGASIWDAGSETAIAANGAFVAGGTNGNRVAQNGTVSFDADELTTFNGLTTGAGYTFDSTTVTGDLSANIYRISFSSVASVPEPSSVALIGLLAGSAVLRRRRK
jgi:hypothetical protein